jgi:ABC-type molybdate transport system substrate-binding protein
VAGLTISCALYRRRPGGRVGEEISVRIEAIVLALLSAAAAANVGAAPETVEIFSAGSLRAVVNELAGVAAPALDVEVKATFGGSGLLRERIEKGEKPDLFMSADLASPRKLEAQGRTVVPAVMIARNRMCIVSRRAAGLTAANLIDRLLATGVRVKTSTPFADPAGDYAWAIFERIDALRPGSGAVLKDKAQALMSLAAMPGTSVGQSPYGALFASGQIDAAITYCSGVASLEKEVPDLASLPVPAELDPHPVDGLAVLSGKPGAMRLALYLLSEKGQAMVARAGLVPVAVPDAAAPP